MADAVGAMIEQLAAARGVSLAALSRMLRRNDAYLQQFVRRGSPRILAERDRRALAQFFGVGEAALGGEPAADAVAVPYLAVAASAGPGAAAASEGVIRIEHFAARMLRDAGVAAANASIIDAAGESMAPHILPGDRLLVDRADRSVPRGGAIFVVRRDGDLLVKRVFARSGGLELTSDNPAYRPIRAATGEAEVIGRVKLLLRRP